jgi:DNA-binding response OmpR family regulator
MTHSATVLLADDDRALRKVLRAYLQEEGFAVLEAGSGPDAVERVRAARPDLVVLDVRMPGFDGFEVLRQLEASGLRTAVMMLTSVSDELDQLVAYRLGAVDYVTKPVSPKVLAAKAAAFLRRLRGEPAEHRTVLGPLAIEHQGRRVTVDGDEVALTRRELELLQALAEHPGWVYSRDQLLARVWGYDDAGGETRLVDMHVANLRRKLEAAGGAGLVETVRGLGYRLARSSGAAAGP